MIIIKKFSGFLTSHCISIGLRYIFQIFVVEIQRKINFLANLIFNFLSFKKTKLKTLNYIYFAIVAKASTKQSLHV